MPATRSQSVPQSLKFRPAVELKLGSSESSPSPDSDAQGNKGDCQCCASQLETINDNVQSILTILEKNEGNKFQQLAPLEVDSVSGSQWDLALHKSFGPLSVNKGEKSRFSEPLSWATGIGFIICILVLAILSADWSSLWSGPLPGVGLDIGEVSKLMHAWARTTLEGLSENSSASNESQNIH
jgi:hypothetical protein